MIKYIEHHLIDECNLNCKGCSHFSPLARPWMETKAQFYKDFSILAQKTEQNIDTIRLMGGEPLLHPDLIWFIQTTRELFPLSEIHVVSNGLLLNSRKEELLPVFNKYNIVLCLSNYGIIPNLNEVIGGFKLTRVDWKNEMYHIGLTWRQVDKNKSFDICDLHTNRWYYFQNGKLYHCCIGANIETFNRYYDESFIAEEGIEVDQYSLEEIEDYLSNPIELCKHCDSNYRFSHESKFEISKKEKEEWICQ